MRPLNYCQQLTATYKPLLCNLVEKYIKFQMSSIAKLTNSLRTLALSARAAPIAQLRTISSSPLRSFVVYNPIYQVATPAKKPKTVAKKTKKAPTEKQLEAEKLKKEKKTAAAKAKRTKESAAKKAQQEKEQTKLKKVQKLAWAKPSKLTAYNLYIKENFDTSISKTYENFKALSDAVKDQWKEKAEKRHAEVLDTYYKGKPERPLTSYAAFIKENYSKYDDGSDFASIVKQVSHKWSQLTAEEKDAFKAKGFDQAAYKEQLKTWRQKRLEYYVEHVQKKSSSASSSP